MARRLAHAISLSAVGAVAAGLLFAAPAVGEGPSTVSTSEERLGTGEVPGRLVASAGFERYPRDLSRALAGARTVAEAERAAERSSRDLWRAAVQRVQSGADGFTADDRPLYWTRLAMIRAVREWRPGFAVPDAQRTGMVTTIDEVSRGQRRAPTGRTVLVTGFDPFRLTRDIRQGNPSGAIALALDGTLIDTPSGPVTVVAMTFPVRWRDFGAGMVERAVTPFLRPGPSRAVGFTTISQGRPGKFDLEAINGVWRGGAVDNEAACFRGEAPVAGDAPQWTRSTLPMAAVTTAARGRYPVVRNPEIAYTTGTNPAVSTACGLPPLPSTTTTAEPPAGALARQGAGGDYLSNEIGYRVTLVRDRLAAPVPGGHLHTPVLDGLPADRGVVESAQYRANLAAVVAQARSVVAVVARGERG
ncbi:MULTISPECIES: pyroglutamyl peptidase [Tsukamurella]|uniref:Pyroglutamyl peptidase n=2 Tax=Tsukamurella TaxID=2060 RepID=A0A5C5RYP9_9ACTN|nr:MULTISPECIES: pyroglutamyl peptidase [Tsukamurella]NMD54254.1 pyroglutamyl peptidase [Tsukamurella columbiensis]TWS28226.1 pyroglutamyl peptidase [Tsukamurella conjunctivitidis]